MSIDSRDRFYLHLAEEISKQSNCLSGNFGSVIVKDDMVIGIGYNGPARGIRHCNLCRRAGSAPGQNYHLCPASHSEVNALLQAGGRERCIGSTLYLNSHNRKPDKVKYSSLAYNSALGFFPCDQCFKYIVNAGVAFVVTEGADGEPVRTSMLDAIEKFNAQLVKKEEDAKAVCVE
jgi:dCMP deaminase